VAVIPADRLFIKEADEGRQVNLTGSCFDRLLLKPTVDEVGPFQDKHRYWIPASAGMTGGFLGKDEGPESAYLSLFLGEE
jgi:hypothetical protein